MSEWYHNNDTIINLAGFLIAAVGAIISIYRYFAARRARSAFEHALDGIVNRTETLLGSVVAKLEEFSRTIDAKDLEFFEISTKEEQEATLKKILAEMIAVIQPLFPRFYGDVDAILSDSGFPQLTEQERRKVELFAFGADRGVVDSVDKTVGDETGPEFVAGLTILLLTVIVFPLFAWFFGPLMNRAKRRFKREISNRFNDFRSRYAANRFQYKREIVFLIMGSERRSAVGQTGRFTYLSERRLVT